MTTLTAYQNAFAAALLADDPQGVALLPEVARLVAQPGFAVYRNTVLKGCIDALQANYPSVTRLVGKEWMRAAAAVYARAQLPSLPSLLVYGDSFPAFLAGFEPAQEVPYLAAVAQVDRLWTESHVAADQPLLDAGEVARLDGGQMIRLTLRPHAATRWLWSDDWPVWTLWSGQRDDAKAQAEAIDWSAEGVLVTRPFGAVAVAPLSHGGVVLLDASARGASIAAAVTAALAVEPALAITEVIEQLLQAGAFTALEAAAPMQEEQQ